MDNGQLGILIQAKLDEALSTRTINEQLQRIAKNIKPLNVTINADVSAIKSATSQITEAQKTIAATGALKLFDASELEKNKVQIFASIDDVRQKYEQLGQIKISNQNIDPITNQLKSFTLQVTEADGIINKLKFDLAALGDGKTGFVPTKFNVTDNSDAIAEKQLQSIQKINAQIEEDNQKRLDQEQADADKLVQIKTQLVEKINGLKQVGILSDSQISNLETATIDSKSLESIKQAESEYTRLLDQQKQILSVEQAKYSVQKQEEAQIQKNTDALAKYIAQFNEKASNLTTNSPLSKYVDTAALQSVNSDLGALNPADPKFAEGLATIKTRFSDIQTNAKAARIESEGFAKALEDSAVKSVALYTAGQDAINGLKDGLQQVIDLNKQLTLISTTANLPQDKVQQLGQQYNQMGQQNGLLTSDIADLAPEFYRQSKDDVTVMDNMTQTMKYAKISNLDYADSAKIVTATMNTMKISSQEATDVFTALGDSVNSSPAEIGTAFQKIGGEAYSLGIPFQQTVSMIATLSDKTREDASTIGDSLKSLYSRIESLKAKGFAQDEQGNTTDVSQVSQALSSIGVDLVDKQTGQFRNIATVLDEVGSKFASLDTVHQRYIATTMAGTLQQSRFLTMMDNWGSVMTNYQTAMNSSGAVTQKFDLYQQGLEAHLNTLKDAWANVFQEGVDTHGVRDAIDMLTALTQALGFVVQHMGLLPVAVMSASMVFSLFTKTGRDLSGAVISVIPSLDQLVSKVTGTGKATKDMGDSIQNVATEVAQTGTKLEAVGTATKTVSVEVEAAGVASRTASTGIAAVGVASETAAVGIDVLKNAFRALLSATLVGAGLTAISFIVEKISGQFMQASDAADAFKQQMDQMAQTFQQNGEQLSQYVQQYSEMSKSVSDGKLASSSQDYLDIQQKIANLMPDSISYVDQYGNAHLKSSDSINKEIQSLQLLAQEKAKQTVDDFNSKYQSNQQTISSKQQEYNQAKKQYDTDMQAMSSPNTSLTDYASFAADADKMHQKMLTLNSDLMSLGQTGQQMLDSVGQALFNQMDGANKASQDARDEAQKMLSQYSPDQFKNGTAIDALTTKYKALIELDSQIQAGQNKDWGTGNDALNAKTQFVDDMSKKAQSAGISIDYLNGEFDKYLGMTKQGSTVVYDFGAANDKLNAQYKDLLKNVQPLSDAIDKLRNGQALTQDEQDKLISQYSGLAGKQQLVNGQYRLTTDALVQVKNQQIDTFNTSMKNTQQELDVQKQALAVRNNIALADINNIKSVSDVKALQAQMDQKALENAQSWARAEVSFHKNGVQGAVLPQYDDPTLLADKKSLNDILTLNQTIQGVKGGVNAGLDFGGVGSGAGGATQQLTALETAINGVDDALNNLQNQMAQYPQHSSQYRDAMQQEIDLLTQKKGLIEQQIANPTAGFSDLSNTPSAAPSGGVYNDNREVSGVDNADSFNKYGKQYNIDPQLLYTIALQESSNGQTSNNIMQLENWNGGSADQNIADGVAHFKENLDKAGGDIKQALAAYNMGDGIIDYFKQNGGYSSQNMDDFSHMEAHKMGWNSYGNPQYVEQAMAKYNDTSPTNTTDPNTGDVTKKQAADVQKAEQSLKQLESQIAQAQLGKVNDLIGQYDDVSNSYNNQIQIIQTQMQGYNKSSKEYVSAIQDEIAALKERQYVAHTSADYIRGTQFADYPEMQKKIQDYQLQWAQLDQQIKQAQQDELNSNLALIGNQGGSIDLKMKQLDATIQANKDKNVSFSGDNVDALNQEIVLMRQKQDMYQQEENEIKNSGLLTEANIQQMQQYESSILDTQSQIEQKQKEVADSIVAVMKNAIQQQINAEDERHQDVINNLDAEAKQHEDQVNAQLKQIDEQKSATDYSYSLNKEQEARQLIQDQLNALGMDNSDDAKSKRADLTKQLADENDKIDKMQSDRTTELRTQNLQDQLEAYKTDVDNKKQAEDDKYQATKDSLQNQLDDAQHWEDVTKEIMDGNVSGVQSEMKKLVDGLNTYAISNADIVNAHINAIKSSIQDLQTAMDSLNGIATTNGSQSNIDSIKQQIASLQQLWKTAMTSGDTQSANEDHLKAVELASQNGGIWNSKTNSYDWTDPSKLSLDQVKQIISQLGTEWNLATLQTDKDSLHQIATQVAALYNGKYTSTGWVFPSDTLQAANGAELPMWGSGGKVGILHQGEIVQTQDQAKDLKTTVSVTKQLADAFLQKGGSFVSNIVQSLNLDKAIQSIVPNVATPSALNPSQYTLNNQVKQGDTHIYNFDQTFNNVKDSDNASKNFVNGLKKLGVQFNS